MSQNTASFAAGCFWGVEARFREIEGVIDAASGYMGGQTENPDYRQVCSGRESPRFVRFASQGQTTYAQLGFFNVLLAQ